MHMFYEEYWSSISTMFLYAFKSILLHNNLVVQFLYSCIIFVLIENVHFAMSEIRGYCAASLSCFVMIAKVVMHDFFSWLILSMCFGIFHFVLGQPNLVSALYYVGVLDDVNVWPKSVNRFTERLVN